MKHGGGGLMNWACFVSAGPLSRPDLCGPKHFSSHGPAAEAWTVLEPGKDPVSFSTA